MFPIAYAANQVTGEGWFIGAIVLVLGVIGVMAYMTMFNSTPSGAQLRRKKDNRRAVGSR